MTWFKVQKAAFPIPARGMGRRLARLASASSTTLAAATETLQDVAVRLAMIREHGDFSLAYGTAVQPWLKYFGDERGYIAYNRHRGSGYEFALGDPVTAPENRAAVIGRFLAAHPRAAFCQISAATATILHERGLYVNDMGIDTVLPLAEYDFRGQEKMWLRYAASWIKNHGFTIREGSAGTDRREEIEAVSQAWRATRVAKREVGFLNRPLNADHEPDTRRFFLHDADGRLLAFVFFDPVCRRGQTIGYVACNKRRHPEAPAYAEPALMKHAIEVFQREGLQELRLGLSPFANLEDREYRGSWVVNKLFRSIYGLRVTNKYFYNVQGHASYKRKFHGREEKLYFATPGWENVFRVMALIKMCKVV